MIIFYIPFKKILRTISKGRRPVEKSVQVYAVACFPESRHAWKRNRMIPMEGTDGTLGRRVS